MKVQFQSLKPEHIPEILEIEQREQGAPWSEQSFRNELSNAVSYFLVGLHQSQVIAYGGLWLVVDEAHVTTVMVAPEFRRHGIGKQLMHRLLEHAQEAGMSCSTLEVRAKNTPAIKLYEQLGYVQAAVRKKYYPNDNEDAIVMWLYDLANWSPQ